MKQPVAFAVIYSGNDVQTAEPLLYTDDKTAVSILLSHLTARSSADSVPTVRPAEMHSESQ